MYRFAAAVSVGQSMYEIGRYAEANNLGTEVLREGFMKALVTTV